MPSWSMDVPEEWERIEPAPTPLATLALDREPSSGFRTNVTVLSQERTDEDAEAYLAASVAGLATAPRAVIVEAWSRPDLDPPGFHFVAAHQHGPHRLTVQQWHRWCEGGAVVASFTCLTDDYPQLQAVASTILETMEVEQ